MVKLPQFAFFPRNRIPFHLLYHEEDGRERERERKKKSRNLFSKKTCLPFFARALEKEEKVSPRRFILFANSPRFIPSNQFGPRCPLQVPILKPSSFRNKHTKFPSRKGGRGGGRRMLSGDDRGLGPLEGEERRGGA